MKPFARMTGAIVLCVLSGCDILDPGSEGLGYLGDTGMPIEISFPDTVQRGVMFDVTIPVYGSGSCTSVERVEVDVTDHVATVRPIVVTQGGVCTSDLHRFVAVGHVTFVESGSAALNVVGAYGALDELGRSVTRDTVIVEHLIVE